jgi:hypothetical protein
MHMSFGSLVFTPVVKILQERHGSRRQYERMECTDSSQQRLGPMEQAFLAEREAFTGRRPERRDGPMSSIAAARRDS